MPAIIDVKASLGAILIGCFIAIAYVAHPHMLRSIPNPGSRYADSPVLWPFRLASTFGCTQMTGQ
jgi:hypothetical protein